MGYYEGMKSGYIYGKVIGTILGDLHVMMIGIDVVTELGPLDGSFDFINHVNLEGLFLGGSLWSTDDKLLGSDEGIKLGLSYCDVIGIILGNIDGINLGLKLKDSVVPSMDPLMVIMIENLKDCCLEVQWDLQMVKWWCQMNETNLDYLIVKCLAPYLDM